MKRITMATVVLCLVAALQVMGQTTSTPKSNPTVKPTPKQPTVSTSASAAKREEAEKVRHARLEEAEKARHARMEEAERARQARLEEVEKARQAMNAARAGTAAGQSQQGTTTIPTPEGTAAAQAQEATNDATNSTPEPASTEEAPEVALKCSGPERRPCSEELVRDLAKRTREKSAEHPALADINTLNLDSSNGTLSCRQSGGRPCTKEQIRALNEHVAAPLKCNLVFEYSAWGTGSRAPTSSKPK